MVSCHKCFFRLAMMAVLLGIVITLSPSTSSQEQRLATHHFSLQRSREVMFPGDCVLLDLTVDLQMVHVVGRKLDVPMLVNKLSYVKGGPQPLGLSVDGLQCEDGRYGYRQEDPCGTALPGSYGIWVSFVAGGSTYHVPLQPSGPGSFDHVYSWNKLFYPRPDPDSAPFEAQQAKDIWASGKPVGIQAVSFHHLRNLTAAKVQQENARKLAEAKESCKARAEKAKQDARAKPPQEVSPPDGQPEGQIVLVVPSSDGVEDREPKETDKPIEGVYRDVTSGLMWQVQPPSRGKRWEEAKSYCSSLSLAGFNDWRLPTITELRSLIRGCPATELNGTCNLLHDGCRAQSCLDASCWVGCKRRGGSPASKGLYWPEELRQPDRYVSSFSERYSSPTPHLYYSATSYHLEGSYAWIVYFDQATTPGRMHVSNRGYVRCVR